MFETFIIYSTIAAIVITIIVVALRSISNKSLTKCVVKSESVSACSILPPIQTKEDIKKALRVELDRKEKLLVALNIKFEGFKSEIIVVEDTIIVERAIKTMEEDITRIKKQIEEYNEDVA